MLNRYGERLNDKVNVKFSSGIPNYSNLLYSSSESETCISPNSFVPFNAFVILIELIGAILLREKVFFSN